MDTFRLTGGWLCDIGVSLVPSNAPLLAMPLTASSLPSLIMLLLEATTEASIDVYSLASLWPTTGIGDIKSLWSGPWSVPEVPSGLTFLFEKIDLSLLAIPAVSSDASRLSTDL